MSAGTVHVLAFSGGKDSTALYLWAIENLGRDGFIALFYDTGWEHPLTYEYVRQLPAAAGGPEILWLKPERSMEELVLYKKTFPTRAAQFCTDELKLKTAKKFIDGLIAEGLDPVMYVGVRRDESPRRANTPEEEWDDRYDCMKRAPLATWTVEQVWEIHRRHGVEPNPLYKLGMNRVGCMPCINSSKAELCAISQRFPEVKDKVSDLERRVNEARVADGKDPGVYFFHPQTVSKGYHSSTLRTKDGSIIPACNIEDVFRWANVEEAGQAPMFEPPACQSRYGLCE